MSPRPPPLARTARRGKRAASPNMLNPKNSSAHPPPARTAGRGQREASPNMWDPNNSSAHQALLDRPYLTAQYLANIKEEDEDRSEDGQMGENSESINSGGTEDEDGTVPLLLSQTEGHRLFVPEGRRLVNNGRMDKPRANDEVMLTTLHFVMTAIQLACTAEGKFMPVPERSQRPNYAFWYPLQGVRSDLRELHKALSAWSRPMEQMRSEDRMLAYNYHTSEVKPTKDEKVLNVYNALRRVDAIDDSYLYPYIGVPQQLAPVNVEIQTILYVLRSILVEGNGPADEEGGATEQHASTDLDSDDFLLHGPFYRPPTPHHPDASTWKRFFPAVPHASLWVGPVEREVFRAVLQLTEKVQAALVAVVKLCEELHAKGVETQKLWETYTGIVEAWKQKRRAAKGPPKLTTYE